MFARYTRDYVTGHDGHQITILQAGCTTADGDLGVSVLREAGADIVVSLIDDDQPVTRAALGADESLAGCVRGDLRTVPLPPRSHDIVLCALLLQRIDHAELVLDRLVAAIRPGGLLLLRFSDRDSSGGFLDRVMPLAARTAVWRKRRPGRPGPYPAVYERLSSVRGIQAYALMRELVIAERQALGGLAGALAEPRGFLAAQKLVAWLSRGRLTAAHEELRLRPAQAGGQVRPDTVTRPGARPPWRRPDVFTARARVPSGMAWRIDVAWAAGRQSGQCAGRR